MGAVNNRTSPFWDREQVRAAVDGAATAKEALARLGYPNKPGNKIRLHEACERYGFLHPSVRRRMRLEHEAAVKAAEQEASKRAGYGSRPRRWSDDDLRSAAHGATSMRQVLLRLDLTATSRNYERVEKYAGLAGVHLPPRRKDKRRSAPQTLPAPSAARRRGGKPAALEDLLRKGTAVKNSVLKRRLIEAGLLEEECAECHTGPEWNGKPLTLQLEHKDGDSTNNELENLELLCPNCHSQTETFCRRKPEEISSRRQAPGEGLEPPTVR